MIQKDQRWTRKESIPIQGSYFKRKAVPIWYTNCIAWYSSLILLLDFGASLGQKEKPPVVIQVKVRYLHVHPMCPHDLPNVIELRLLYERIEKPDMFFHQQYYPFFISYIFNITLFSVIYEIFASSYISHNVTSLSCLLFVLIRNHRLHCNIFGTCQFRECVKESTHIFHPFGNERMLGYYCVLLSPSFGSFLLFPHLLQNTLSFTLCHVCTAFQIL